MQEKIKKIIRKYPRLVKFLKKYRRHIAPNIFSTVVSYEQAATYTKELARKIPNEFDLIIGVPRSGLFVASILATRFARPLSTPESFLEKKMWKSELLKENKRIEKVLLVDDSVGTGKTFKKLRKDLLKASPHLVVKTAALFSLPGGKKEADYCLFVKKQFCVFEWQIFHGTGVKTSVDMDGVLCEDCTSEAQISEKSYIYWMKNVRPFIIPAFKIDTIVTCRLERYRKITEEWLSKNNVKYNHLDMINLSSNYGKTYEKMVNFKVNTLKKNRPDWFWESNFKLAHYINKKTGIPTLCTDEMVLLDSKGRTVK